MSRGAAEDSFAAPRPNTTTHTITTAFSRALHNGTGKEHKKHNSEHKMHKKEERKTSFCAFCGSYVLLVFRSRPVVQSRALQRRGSAQRKSLEKSKKLRIGNTEGVWPSFLVSPC